MEKKRNQGVRKNPFEEKCELLSIYKNKIPDGSKN